MEMTAAKPVETPMVRKLFEDDGAAFVRPSADEARAAVATLIRWAGDDPDREGMKKTPERVIKAFREMFCGYEQDPEKELETIFKEVGGYEDLVIVRDIQFHSHCEHHMVAFMGHVTIGYIPNGGVLGLSKFARIVDIFARRFQTQETMTSQIADAIEKALKPHGIAVIARATHMCMEMRGVRKTGSTTQTQQFRGRLQTDRDERREFLRMAGGFDDR